MKILFPRLRADSGVFSVVDCPVVVRAAALDVAVPLEVFVGIDDRCRENGTWTPLVVDGNPVTIGGDDSHVVLSLPGKYRLGAVTQHDDDTRVTVEAVCDQDLVTNDVLWNLSRVFAGGSNPGAGVSEARVVELIQAALAGNPGSGVSEARVNELIQAALVGIPTEPGVSEARVVELIQAALAELPSYPAPTYSYPPEVDPINSEVGAYVRVFEGLWQNATEVNGVLIHNGIDVSDQIDGSTWEPTEPGPYNYTVTATGPGGSTQFGPIEGTVVEEGSGHAHVPLQVTGLISNVVGQNVELVWDAPADGGSPITDYEVVTAPSNVTNPAQATALADTAGDTSTSRNLPGVPYDTTRNWWVRAINALGAGPWSEMATYAVGAEPSSVVESLIVGYTDTNSITVSAKVSDASSVVFSAVPTAGGATITSTPVAANETYLYAQTTISGLQPDTDYVITPQIDGVDQSKTGAARTRPASARAFGFAFSSCMGRTRNHPILTTIADTAGVEAFVHLGDWGYFDPAAGTTSEDFAHQYTNEALANSHWDTFHRAMPFFYMFDDHEFRGGGGNSNDSTSTVPAIRNWYRNRMAQRPVRSGTSACHQLIEFAPGFKVFLMDTRTHRTSGNFLGAEQEADLMAAIAALQDNPTHVLGISGGVPIISSTDTDTWAGAAAQRQRIADAIIANAPGRVFWMHGDAHMLAFDDGTNGPGGAPVFGAAPLGRANSTKGGPYSGGTVTATQNQFGTIHATPTAEGWSITFKGYSVDATGAATERLTFTTELKAPAPVEPVTPKASFVDYAKTLSPQLILMDKTGSQWIDASGNGRHAAIVGTEGGHTTEGPFGLPFFAGTPTSYAMVPADVAFDTGDFSYLVFVRPVTAVSNMGYISRGENEKLSIGNSVMANVTYRAHATSTVNTVGAAAQNLWTMLAMTYDAAAGVRKDYSSVSGSVAQVSTKTAAGRFVTTDPIIMNGRSVAGVIDRSGTMALAAVCRFGRALTASEITTLYQKAAGLIP